VSGNETRMPIRATYEQALRIAPEGLFKLGFWSDVQPNETLVR
jgi:hypothetical protein